MKPVEEAFASGTVRRVILPGIVLAAGVHPLISTLAPIIDSLYGVGTSVLFVAEVVFFGLIVSSATQWIYYVYEGFRLQLLTTLAGPANQRRVRQLSELMNQLQTQLQTAGSFPPSQENSRIKTYEALLDFPVRQGNDGKVEHFAERPTRLGNIIATYELYPKTVYGVDGVFYWFHLLNFASENSRREFADQSAFAESLVLTSFSGALVAFLHALVLIGFGIGIWSHRLVFVVLQTGPKTSLSLMAFGITVWASFYAAALPAYREAGKMFKSIVDIAMPSFVEWVQKVNAPLGDAATHNAKKVRNYLLNLSDS
jgi:hypothetical protein